MQKTNGYKIASVSPTGALKPYTLFLLLVVLLLPALSLAQQPERNQPPTIDTIQQRLDTIQVPSTRADSIKNIAENKMDSLNLVQSKLETKLDSLNPQHQLDRVNSKVDSVQNRLSSKIDSLTTLNLGDSKIVKSLDSLRSKLDSLKMLGPVKDLKKAEERLSGLQNGVTSKIDKVESKINAPLGKYAENGANLPGSVNLPGTEQLGSLPGATLPNTNLSKTGLDNLNLNTPGRPDMSIGKLDVGNLKPDELGELNAGVKGIGGAGDDLKGITELADSEKLSEAAESKLKNLDGVGELETGQIDYAAMVKKWNSDPDVARELALGKAKEEAVNHFAGHEEELKAVMEQMTKLKQKKPDAEGVIDLFAKRKHSLKNKPFVERLLPGVNFQINAAPIWWFDFNSYVGYKLTGRFTMGLGWNERLAVNFKEWHTVTQDRIYGPRTYLEFKWKEHISLKLESEWMNTFPRDPLQIDQEGRSWVWTSFAGIKNVFNLGEGAKGHVHILYNLFDRDNNSPYVSKINVRFGFEFPIHKIEKETRKSKPVFNKRRNEGR